jgi:hypothetical protein
MQNISNTFIVFRWRTIYLSFVVLCNSSNLSDQNFIRKSSNCVNLWKHMTSEHNFMNYGEATMCMYCYFKNKIIIIIIISDYFRHLENRLDTNNFRVIFLGDFNANKGWSSSLGVGRGANNSSP